MRLFAEYLVSVGVTVDPAALGSEPTAWAGLSWGVVDGFVKWMITEGYAVGSVNIRLATVKRYTELASKAGAVDPGSLMLIKAVKGYSPKEAGRIDDRRAAADLPTRLGHKKAGAIVLDRQQVATLKNQPDTPQGRRDRLIICLMVDQGLRVGEVAGLQVGDFDLSARQIVFYRAKVHKVQTHDLTKDTYQAAAAYLAQDGPALGPLLRGSRKNGELYAPGMATKISPRWSESWARLPGLRGYQPTTCATPGPPWPPAMGRP